MVWILKETNEHALYRTWQILYLIEKQNTAASFAYQTGSILVRAGKCALDVSKKLAHGQFRLQGPA
jgi:hypothetical protein